MDISLGIVTWRTGCCPCNLSPLSIPLTDPKEQQGCHSLAPTGSQELPEWSWGQCWAALGVPTLDFSSRFTPEAFFMTGYCCKAVEVLSQSFLLLDEQPSQADKPHLPKASGYEAPKTHLCYFSSSVEAALLGLEAKPHVQARNWTLVVRGYLRCTPWRALYK